MVMGDMETYTDLLVIGSGPGGYSCAFRGAFAARLSVHEIK